MRNEILWNDNWSFTETECGVFDGITSFPQSFSPVDIPHDFLIYDAENLYRSCDGWYRKICTFTSADKTFLHFEGIYMDSTIYINRKQAGQWKYGYTEFEIDITSFLQEGENEVLVRVLHRSPNSRWYSGAGIYRNVHLIQKNTLHIKHNGLYISTKKNGPVFSVSVSSSLSSILSFSVSRSCRPSMIAAVM